MFPYPVDGLLKGYLIAIFAKKCPAEAEQYFQAKYYVLRFHSVGCLRFFGKDRIWIWFFVWIGLGFGFRIGCLCLLAYASVALTIQDYGAFRILESIGQLLF